VSQYGVERHPGESAVLAAAVFTAPPPVTASAWFAVADDLPSRFRLPDLRCTRCPQFAPEYRSSPILALDWPLFAINRLSRRPRPGSVVRTGLWPLASACWAPDRSSSGQLRRSGAPVCVLALTHFLAGQRQIQVAAQPADQPPAARSSARISWPRRSETTCRVAGLRPLAQLDSAAIQSCAR